MACVSGFRKQGLVYEFMPDVLIFFGGLLGRLASESRSWKSTVLERF